MEVKVLIGAMDTRVVQHAVYIISAKFFIYEFCINICMATQNSKQLLIQHVYQ